MSPVHLNPLDAVAVHQDLHSSQSVGMHWLTFILTDEPIFNPAERLARELIREQIDPDAFIVMTHGQTIHTCPKHFGDHTEFSDEKFDY